MNGSASGLWSTICCKSAPDHSAYVGITYIQLMGEIGFSGYFCYELCHHIRTPDGKTATVDSAHEQAAMASEYMSDILARQHM
jgi:hypothetical protein